jgi:hypothetical protein
MRSLGICWIFYGVWRLVLAAILVLGSGTATMMFGAVLTRVADPYSLMAAFHALYIGAILLSVLCGVLGILAGLSLQGREESGRRIAVLASLFSLPELPLGVMLGCYTLHLLARVPASLERK